MVHIITDTTAGLPAAVARTYDIPVIPQVIHFGSESFLEGVDLDNVHFMQRLRQARELPKTAAPPPELFIEAFQRLTPLGEPILCMHPSAELSGTVRSALTAKVEFPAADIRVIDTRLIGSPLATLVTLAAEWAKAGMDASSIVERIHIMIPHCHIYFVVATLEYLARGGRIGGATALLGSVMQIKPILALKDGKIDVLERERTQKRAMTRVTELVYERIARDGSGYPSVMHAAEPERAHLLADELRAHLGVPDVPILDVPPAIVVHGGPGILGVAFFSQTGQPNG